MQSLPASIYAAPEATIETIFLPLYKMLFQLTAHERTKKRDYVFVCVCFESAVRVWGRISSRGQSRPSLMDMFIM